MIRPKVLQGKIFPTVLLRADLPVLTGHPVPPRLRAADIPSQPFHAESGTAEGIPNYLHILETVLQLLLSQLERVAAGLEAESETKMTVNQWHGFRNNLADYYGLLETLLKLTANEYVQGLLEVEDERDVMDGFGDSPSKILGIYDRAIELRDEIVQVAQDRVRIPTPNGSFTGGRFFRTRIANEKWPGYRKGIQVTGERLRALGAA